MIELNRPQKQAGPRSVAAACDTKPNTRSRFALVAAEDPGAVLADRALELRSNEALEASPLLVSRVRIGLRQVRELTQLGGAAGMTELAEGLRLDLPNSLARDAEETADFL